MREIRFPLPRVLGVKEETIQILLVKVGVYEVEFELELDGDVSFRGYYCSGPPEEIPRDYLILAFSAAKYFIRRQKFQQERWLQLELFN